MVRVRTMINKNFKEYAIHNWQNDTYVKPLSVISAPDSESSPLIDSSKVMYCFDDINKSLYHKNKPTSVDGLFFYNNTAYFVEFKTGYKKKITRENYCEEKVLCPTYNSHCKVFGDLFFKIQQKETEELNSSIRSKAVDSYITFEKQILPCCEKNGKCKINLLVVIDADAIVVGENVLSEVAGEYAPQKTVNNNEIAKLKNSLSNYRRKRDKYSPSNDYFYDEIEVMSAEEFIRFFDNLIPDMIDPSCRELPQYN